MIHPMKTLVHLLAVQAVKEHRAGDREPQLLRIFSLLSPVSRKQLLEAARNILKRIK